jgi:hypothetical protein
MILVRTLLYVRTTCTVGKHAVIFVLEGARATNDVIEQSVAYNDLLCSCANKPSAGKPCP